MSTQNRTNAGSKAPVSSHPLFPAIVALWFGALFGLGSLAVRVSLIESLIIASRIDLIVPMAAPPLGMTARILIALTMAMIGIAVGAAIARRITRPKQVVPNRRRTAGSVSEARKAEFVRQVQIQQEEQRIAADKADAVRRRALASGEVEAHGAHRDEAPLPGGAPQILDVTQFDLAAPGSFETDLVKPLADAAPLDLAGFDAPATTQAAFAEPARFDAPTPVLESAPVLESYGDDTDSFRAKFANEKKPVAWTPEPPADLAANFAADDFAGDAAEFVAEGAEPVAARRFDPNSLDPMSLDAASLEADAWLQAENEPGQHESDFAEPFALTDAFAEIPQASAAVFAGNEPPASVGPAAHEAKPETVPSAAPAPEAAPVATPFMPQASAAERIASADLSELSPVELVERFALALAQRRHTGAFPAGLLDAAAAFDLPVRPQPSQVPEVLAAMTPAASISSEAPPSEVPGPASATALAAEGTAVPLFAAATAASSDSDDAPAAAMRLSAQPPNLPLTLPAAMRPIEFGHHEEHDDLPDYVPPRSFAMPRLAGASGVPGAPEPVCADPVAAGSFPAETAPLAASAAALPAAAEADVNEEGYSSLLALTRSAPLRQTFVRVEEPASESGQIEPVVIFPGQATRPGTRFSRPADNAAPAQAPVAPMPGLAEVPQGSAATSRRFDSPGAAAPGTGGMPDPDEAERALRSALATLQRMSGAA